MNGRTARAVHVPSRPRVRWLRVRGAGIVLGLLISGGVVWQSSQAAFTATTPNPNNAWTAGTVTLTNSGSAGASFTATNIKPTDTGNQCIDVTYTGSLNASIKLYATSYTNVADMGGALTLLIESGGGANCASPGSWTSLHTTTLDSFATTNIAWGSGLGTFTPTPPTGMTKPYRFTWTMGDVNAAQGDTASVTFTWESRNT